MRSAEACSPGRFFFSHPLFFTGSADSEIARLHSRRATRGNTRTHTAVRRRPADNTVSRHVRRAADSDPDARMCRCRACSCEGWKTRKRRFLHSAADLLQQFHVRPRKPLSLRRKAYKKVAFTVPNDRRLRFSTAFSGGAKQKRPRPQQGAFRTSSPFV